VPGTADVILPGNTIKRIHVAGGDLRRCVKTGTDEPVVIVRTSSGAYRGRDVEIHGPSRMVQSLTKPMPGCGARVWLETRSPVTIKQAEFIPDACDMEVAA
jgi:hypothetical protein